LLVLVSFLFFSFSSFLSSLTRRAAGQELVVLLITPAPLFDTPRPESESRTDYLRALDTRLKQLASKYGQDHIVADFAQITSKARAR